MSNSQYEVLIAQHPFTCPNTLTAKKLMSASVAGHAFGPGQSLGSPSVSQDMLSQVPGDMDTADMPASKACMRLPKDDEASRMTTRALAALSGDLCQELSQAQAAQSDNRQQ